MAKKIAVAIRKGGSRKTTIAVNLASALASLGKNVLLVDLDPQSNATMHVGVDTLAIDKHINTLFTDAHVRLQEIIMETGFNFYLMPSHPDLADTETGMTAQQIGLVKSILEPIDSYFEYSVLDTPPHKNYLTTNALVASNVVFIPTQVNFFALHGLQELLDEINNIKKGLNPSLVVSGILPVMSHSRTLMAKTIMDALHSKYGNLVYPFQVEFSVKHAEASLAGKPLVLYDPEHAGSQVYIAAAQSLL